MHNGGARHVRVGMGNVKKGGGRGDLDEMRGGELSITLRFSYIVFILHRMD